MDKKNPTEIILIRHAEPDNGGKLCGRTDIPAFEPPTTRLTSIRSIIPAPASLISSPALRCRQTAGWIWPEHPPELVEDLWEQDFGEWEGVPLSDLPDIGDFDREELAEQRPPNGESFADLFGRVSRELSALSGKGDSLTLSVHAGVIRAALTLASSSSIGVGLGYRIDPLSLTKLTRFPSGQWRIDYVNWQPEP